MRETVNPVRKLFDVCTRGRTIKLTCRCGRSTVFAAHAVWHRFRQQGWSERLSDVPPKFRCENCGARRPRLEFVYEHPTSNSLPMPSEGEWKRELARRR